MGARISGLANALYDSKKKQFLGRDGAGWGKLGVFYFFFYVGLAGFFCAMLAVFMALSPRDHPRYYHESSRMRTRSSPLSPGLGFRPQPQVDKNIILIEKNAPANESNPYVRNLNQYLYIYYSQQDRVVKKETDGEENTEETKKKPVVTKKFQINYPGDCTRENNYGFGVSKPCVLVKMNKIVDFRPKPGAQEKERDTYRSLCDHKQNAIAIHCYGEYPADVDNIGTLKYISENGDSAKCGALETKHFPYKGKVDRQDVYQAPYIWVQFLNPEPNVLINVLCRAYGQNIDFDKKTGRALTRFQIYVDSKTNFNSTQRKS
jgi:sodium/potassium-transporting ATPase subunit beta